MFPDAESALVEDDRTLTSTDFMSGATEDRYPDVFRLARAEGGGRPEVRAEITGLLDRLAHHSVVLGHDTDAADFLGKLTGTP
ncbi:hypothetical protein [Streptomyces sp. NPDC059564]|uniref:hypothetical protein n=1 Tax=Streptomyces sp. NPDC059564 TaxID=3346865 RepID=UPI0036C959A8